ncbi:MAG: HAD-IIIA family hydrolase [Burkholderiales bacterium]|nr:HAD-IIIA family hydrolase [Burkholderiales bacterium]
MASAETLARAGRVRLMIFDVDGVLTDGTLYYSASGEELKAFNIRDGQGMKMLAGTGVRLAIVSGRRSAALARRAADLGVDLLYQGIEDKLAAFDELTARLALAPEACGFLGDDLIDLPVLARCGFAAAVADAAPEIRARAHYVTAAPGGRGAARETCELVMRAQGTLAGALARYLA